MNNDYFIRNFRVFDKEGVTIPLKPITILTGCNSSGKSSIVKSMVLLDSYLKGILADYEDGKKIDVKKYKLDFSSGENTLLGGFDRALHRKSRKPFIDFGYTVHSLLLGEDVKVIFRFGSDENDKLNDGYLLFFSIETSKGHTIYTSDKNHKLIDNSIIHSFYRFVLGQYVVREFRKTDSADFEMADYYDGLKEEYNKLYGKEAIDDIIERENNLPQIHKCLKENESFAKKYLDDKTALIHYSRDFGTLFYVSIFRRLSPMNKKRLRNFEEKLASEGKYNEYIKAVFDDFYSSKFKTFGKYFRHKEFLYLNYIKDFDNYPFPNYYTPETWSMAPGWRLSDDNIVQEIFNRYNDSTIDFIKVYDALLYLNSSEKVDYLKMYSMRESKIYEMFKDYYSQVIEEIITTAIPHNLSYVSSSLVNIKRLYSLEGSDSFSILLKKYLSAERAFLNSKHEGETYSPGSFMNKWLRELKIGHSIIMNVDDTQTGVTIRLYEGEKDRSGCLLSEQGYGITQLFVILLRIETAILESRRYYSFGLYSSVDPWDMEDYPISYAPSTIAIEEPEVHQHPKLQSMLADIFVDAYKNYNVQFIVETHSEYLIRKLQYLVADRKVSNNNVSLVYVYNADPKRRPIDTPQVKSIDILMDGRLSDRFGEGFFDEADRLVLNLLKTKTS